MNLTPVFFWSSLILAAALHNGWLVVVAVAILIIA